MSFISKKKIKGKEYKYLEKSVRLLDGKVKKFSVYLKETNKTKEKEKELNKKIVEYQTKFARSYFSGSLKGNEIAKLEQIRINYKKIRESLTNKQMQDVLDRFAINFTYESNAIEGNSLTLKDVTFVIQENKTIEGKDLREIYETLNMRKALDFVFSKPKLTMQNIIALHRLVVKNTGVKEGFKTLPNFLIGRMVKTTPPEKVEEELKKLISWYNEQTYIHPLEKACYFHGKFEKIHPFEDGNGRVGRLLINLMLIQHNYPPIIIRKTQRVSYFHSLEAFDNRYKTRLLRFFVEKYKDTYKKFFEVYIKYL